MNVEECCCSLLRKFARVVSRSRVVSAHEISVVEHAIDGTSIGFTVDDDVVPGRSEGLIFVCYLIFPLLFVSGISKSF